MPEVAKRVIKDDDDEPVAAPAPEVEASPPPKEETDLRAVTWPIKIKLQKPIPNAKKDSVLHEITFREPTARDILACGGNPWKFDSDGRLVVDPAPMLAMMARLSSNLPPHIEEMSPSDFNGCAMRLVLFFAPDMRGWI